MGRKPIGSRAMSATERTRRHRAKKRLARAAEIEALLLAMDRKLDRLAADLADIKRILDRGKP